MDIINIEPLPVSDTDLRVIELIRQGYSLDDAIIEVKYSN